jgi:hypothetical protein
MALLQYGFEALHLHRIIATCQPENVASCLVMERRACDERPTFESASGVRIIGCGTNTSMLFWKKSGSRPIRYNLVGGCEHVVKDSVRVDDD